MICVEVQTCSWCTIETLWSYLEQHQTDDGAYLCDDCWDDYTETSHELAKTVLTTRPPHEGEAP